MGPIQDAASLVQLPPSQQARAASNHRRGGARKGAGRKPGKGPRKVSHRARPVFTRRTPVHVTLRMAAHINLRTPGAAKVVEVALRGGAERFEVSTVEVSVQGDHVHLIVEAGDHVALARAIKGLSIRTARALNQMMGSRGRVFGDRYQAHVLRTPAEVRNALDYVRTSAGITSPPSASPR